MAEQDKKTLIEFPCDFPIKVMGEMRDDLAETIIAVIREQLPDFDAGTIEMRASSGGRFISLTCTVHVTSKPQLDDIYRTLTSHPLAKVVL